MKEETISAKEIAELKQSAEAKRILHREIMHEIILFASEGTKSMLPERQLEIIKRGHEDEIMALLKAFKNRKLSPEAQQYIYTHREQLSNAYAYMIEHMKLCFELEKQLFAYFKSGKQRRYSTEAEVYIVQKVMEEADEIPPVKTFLHLFKEYSTIYQMSDKAEELMVKSFLTKKNGWDSVIDGLRHCVEKYLETHKSFSAKAQQELIKTGDHSMILLYIQKAYNGLDDTKAVNLLLERANRAEIEAYYERYVEL